jgi:hypothetical protein
VSKNRGPNPAAAFIGWLIIVAFFFMVGWTLHHLHAHIELPAWWTS